MSLSQSWEGEPKNSWVLSWVELAINRAYFELSWVEFQLNSTHDFGPQLNSTHFFPPNSTQLTFSLPTQLNSAQLTFLWVEEV